jgi:hypothetical protein
MTSFLKLSYIQFGFQYCSMRISLKSWHLEIRLITKRGESDVLRCNLFTHKNACYGR